MEQPATMETPREARSSSTFLQDMIKEKKSQTQRLGRARDVSGSSHLRNLSGREFHSSPIAPPRGDKISNTSRKASGTRPQGAPKEMGLREMQEHISRIDKQNFDLKLQIFHQRQKCDALEAKVAKVEELEKENEELRLQNEDLSLKLEGNDEDIETREIAIEEAVGMICELEAKVEDYQRDLERYRAVVDAEVAPAPPVHSSLQSPVTSPIKPPTSPSLERSGSHSRHPAIRRVASIASGPKSPLRPPSFLNDERKSNTALRSLYSSGNPSVASFNRDGETYSDSDPGEELDRQMMASPRLSILSETGFSSIMGHTPEDSVSPPEPHSPERNLIMPSDSQHERTAQHQARINRWVEDNNRHEPPRTPVRQPSQKKTSNRFSSIGELLDEPSNSFEVLNDQHSTTRSPEKARMSGDSTSHSRSPSKSLRKSARIHDKLPPPIIAGSPFNSVNLPPTPETMSTATIGANSSTQSIITERSLADGTIMPTNGYASLMDKGRPNSADRRYERRLSSSNKAEGRAVAFGNNEVISTRVEQGEASIREQGGFMSGSLKGTRFFGADAPRRPVLNTHVTDMMFNGDGFSPKHASRTVSYPSAPRSRERSMGAPSPTSQRSSATTSSRTVTSPRRSQPSPTKANIAPSPPQRFADMVEDAEDDDNKPRQTSSLRFRLPKRHAPSNGNIQSVTSRIFRRNRAPAPESEQEVEAETQHARPSSGPRPNRSSAIPALPLPRPGTADGSTKPENSRQSVENRRWTLMRRHSAVLDDSFIHEAADKDEETGLRRVAESRATMRAGEEGRFKNAKAKLRDGFGLRR